MATVPTEFDIEALAGPVQEIRRRLGSTDDSQLVAFRLEHASEKLAREVATAVRLIAPMVVRRLVDRDEATLDKLVELLVPPVAPPEHLLTIAKMNVEARKEVFASAEWLNAAQLSKVAGFSGQNASAQPNKWKREGKIFAVRQNGNDLYPSYALDARSGYRPVKELAPILAVFNGARDDWDIAIWFASANSFLGGATPMSLLTIAPERVLAAAEDEVVGVVHG